METIWLEALESFVEEMGLLEKGWEVCLERACSMANREKRNDVSEDIVHEDKGPVFELLSLFLT